MAQRRLLRAMIEWARQAVWRQGVFPCIRPFPRSYGMIPAPPASLNGPLRRYRHGLPQIQIASVTGTKPVLMLYGTDESPVNSDATTDPPLASGGGIFSCLCTDRWVRQARTPRP